MSTHYPNRSKSYQTTDVTISGQVTTLSSELHGTKFRDGQDRVGQGELAVFPRVQTLPNFLATE